MFFYIYNFFLNCKTSFAYHVIFEAMSQKCVVCNSKCPVFISTYFLKLLYNKARTNKIFKNKQLVFSKSKKVVVFFKSSLVQIKLNEKNLLKRVQRSPAGVSFPEVASVLLIIIRLLSIK